MNNIKKIPVTQLGYQFIPTAYLPKGKDEYYLRNMQNRSGITYRNLSAFEIEILVRNRNTSDNWNNILVSELFNPDLVRNCKFFGLVRIGKLENIYLEYNAVSLPVGLYNSTIISCDFGDNVVIDNVNYLSHYIIGNEAIIVNVNEMANTNYSKFGNGIIKEGESENIRIWLEVRNENGGRKVVPFSGMLPGDAYIWSQYRNDDLLLSKLLELTQKQIEPKRGFYGKVGDRTVIKNCKILKDVWIGSDAYLKGANKIKNVTINSDAQRKSQIGEGCELVNGIIGYGCRAFYGVKAVRFVMSSHSQLKYGARLINSFLGSNATISCCEVLNSLIFPSHEQHHNNSFLCAAMIMGQSNIAAGATIGSNHNSRAADGEIVANRGFWPGLCVSLKHNSRFASFTMIAKGDYPAELDNPFPFALISNELHTNTLLIMPAYWSMYNMYALSRNSNKYAERDARTKKIQQLEFNYLAPDTINEIIAALPIICKAVGKAYALKNKIQFSNDEGWVLLGEKLLKANDKNIDTLEVYVENIENSNRNVKLLKSRQAYHAYILMIENYFLENIFNLLQQTTLNYTTALKPFIKKKYSITNWENVGGQLMTKPQVQTLIAKIKSGNIKSWQAVRDYYQATGHTYEVLKLEHAIAVANKYLQINLATIKKPTLKLLLNRFVEIESNNVKQIIASRAKDYDSPFKQMLYSNKEEMEKVIGSLENNSFIVQKKQELNTLKKQIALMIK
jgi:hypothetical protein